MPNPITGNIPSSAELALLLAGSRQLMYAQKTVKAGDTIANTTTKTAFASQIVFAANTAQVGQIFTAKGYGTYNAPLLNFGTTTCGLQLMNSVTNAPVSMVTSPALTNAANVAAMPFSFEVVMVVQGIGATGTVRSCGNLIFNNSLTTAQTIALSPVISTVDTTVTQTLQCFTQFSIANVAISSSLQLFFVEVLNPVSSSN